MSKIRIEKPHFATTVEIPRPLGDKFPLAWINIVDEIGVDKGQVVSIEVAFLTEQTFLSAEEVAEQTYLRLRVFGKDRNVLAEVKIPLSKFDAENQAAYDKWHSQMEAYQEEE